MKLACLLLLLVQEEDLAGRLKVGGWSAVEELGARPAAKAGLAELSGGKDAEVRWWAGAALAELEAREQAGDGYVGPLLVSLEAKDQAVSDVFRDLLDKAGLKVSPIPEGDRTVTVSIARKPFLQALDDLCRQADCSLARLQTGEFQVTQGDWIRGPRFYHGTFAAVVTSLTKKTEVTFKEEPYSRLVVGMALRCDPRARMLDQDPMCQIVAAADDAGRSLLVEGQRPATRLHAFTGRVQEQAALTEAILGVPAKDARKVALLRGVATVTMARKTEEIVFEKVLTPESKTREAAGVKALLKSCSKEGDQIQLELELTSKARVHWPDSDGIALEDAQGLGYHRWGSSSSWGGTRASYRLTYRDRDGVGAPVKLRFSVITETYPRKVYFELKDIPLK